MCKTREMKSFIGNPFDSEFVDDEDMDELQATDVWNTFAMDNRNILPSDDEDNASSVVFFNDNNGDDPNDPDYELNEEDNSLVMDDLEFDSESEHNTTSSTHLYVCVFSSDEDDDDIDYVTFPLKTEAQGISESALISNPPNSSNAETVTSSGTSSVTYSNFVDNAPNIEGG